jgi:ATP-binding cassette subfamily F protein uup
MLGPADLLVLDEPTNDLDIPTLQNLEEALLGFGGTLVLVSHDRFFLDQVATHTLAWNESGSPRWELYEGPPSTVCRLRRARAAEQGSARTVASRLVTRTEAAKPRKAGLSQKEQRRLEEVERALAALHDRCAELDAVLADPSAFLRPGSPGHQALKDRDSSRPDLEALELEWLALEEKRTGD